MKFERPLLPKEIDALNAQLKPSEKSLKKKFLFLCAWTLVALMVGTYAYFKVDPQAHVVLYVTVAAYIGIGAWIVAEAGIKTGKITAVSST